MKDKQDQLKAEQLEQQTPVEQPADGGENEQEQSSRLKKTVTLISIILFVVFLGILSYLVGKPLIEFIRDDTSIREWIAQNPVLGRLAFLGLVMLQVVVAFIPGEPLEIAAGFAFGPLEGTLICLAGMALGSMIIFLFVKKIGVRVVRVFISQEKIDSMKFINNSKRLNTLMFILFFIPGTPKDIFTYMAGLTPMKLTTFLLITTIARIPSVITSTIGGDALHGGDIKFAIIVFAITAVISAVGLIIYNRFSKKQNEQSEQEETAAQKIGEK